MKSLGKMSPKNVKTELKPLSLEAVLEDLGFRKYVPGESTYGTEECLHRWYREDDKWKIDFYIKKKARK